MFNMGDEEQMTGKMEATKKVIEEVNAQFKNPVNLLILSLALFPQPFSFVRI